MPTVTSNTFTVPATSGGSGLLDLPLYDPANVTYVGSFQYANGHSGFASGMGKNAGEMITAGDNSQKRAVGVQTIPAVGGTAVRTKAPVNLPGIPGQYFGGSCASTTVGGFYYHAPTNKILCEVWCNYAGASEFALVTSCDADTLGGFTTAQGLSNIWPDTSLRHYSSYMCGVPAEWQALLGGDVLLGGGPMSGRSNSAPGFSALAINGAAVTGSGSIPSVPLFSHDWDSENESKWFQGEYHHTNGMCIVPGTRTLLYWGVEGQTNSSNSDANNAPIYGEPGVTLPAAADPCDTAKGYHAYPYRGAFFAFDLRDIVDAKNQVIPHWQPMPYNLTDVGTDGGYKHGLGTPMPGPLGAWGCMSTNRGRGVTAFHDPVLDRVYFTPRDLDPNDCYVFQL